MTEHTPSLDWSAAKEHFDAIRQHYLDLDGMPGVNVQFALKLTFEPLSRRFAAGERTTELHQAMLDVE